MPEFSVFLPELTWPEAQTALAKAEIVLIPLGSNEQHGPGMTLNTDIVLATAVARRLAEKLRPMALVAPALPFGLSPHHMRFPGTITLQPETFSAVLMDVIASLKAHGVRRFFLLNGHGGNQTMLSVIAMEAKRRFEIEIATAIYLLGASDLMRERFGRTIAHACDIEASVGLAIAPEIVRVEALAKGEEVASRYRYTGAAGGGSLVGSFIDTAMMMEEMTTNGAIGDPRKATEADGRALVELAEQRLLEFLDDFLRGGTTAGASGASV